MLRQEGRAITGAGTKGLALLSALATLTILASCYLPSPSFTTGRYISSTALKSIEPGRTTKQELLESFGPPMGILARGERVYVQRPVQWEGGMASRWRVDLISAETFFELFREHENLGPEHRVYYYYRASGRQRTVFLLVYINEKSWLEMDRLWVLVNEKTGIVEDYVFRPRKMDKG